MATETISPIALAVTPAVMVSACGLIALGLDNQAARMSARFREMARDYRSEHYQSSHLLPLRQQMDVLGRRHGLYIKALMLNYGALLAFVLTSLLFLASRFLPVSEAWPMGFFTAGVVMLGLMAVMVLESLRFSRRAIRVEGRRTVGTKPLEAGA